MIGNRHASAGDRSPGRDSQSRAERGQTTQDFAVGIGIFLLTTAFVFVYLTTIGTPFDSGIGGAETAQADRIADRIVENASTTETNTSELEWGEYDDRFNLDADDDLDGFVDAVGIRANTSSDVAFDRVNISVRNIEDESLQTDASGGHTYDNQTAASSGRIVTFDDGVDCDPACRLIVRVW